MSKFKSSRLPSGIFPRYFYRGKTTGIGNGTVPVIFLTIPFPSKSFPPKSTGPIPVQIDTVKRVIIGARENKGFVCTEEVWGYCTLTNEINAGGYLFLS